MWFKENNIMPVDLEEALQDAHEDYLYRRAEIITKLISIRDSEINNDVMKIWINQAIEFIKEKEI